MDQAVAEPEVIVEHEDSRERIRALHNVPHKLRISHVIAIVLEFAFMAGTILALHAGWWPILIPMWAVMAWMHHAALTRLHECAHGTMTRTRWLNESLGILIGTSALTPLSVYRWIHHKHHAYLGDPRDPEFWPYSDIAAPRAERLAYAWTEVFFGWIFTPWLYSVRAAEAWTTIVPLQRRRLIMEWAFLIAFWAVVVGVVWRNGWWAEFAVAHIVPAWLAGGIQTIRKFTEHMGCFGPGILGMTRTVVHERLPLKAASRSQLHVDHHGTHHRWARIPYYSLPEATAIAYAAPGAPRTYRNYWQAMVATAPHMLDPKIGPAWLESPGRHASTVEAKPRAHGAANR